VVRRYLSYAGSLTTPPCSEGVRWFVLRQPVEVSQDTIDRLHDIVRQFPDYDAYPNNNRPLQALNGRRVIVRKSPRD
jgi:carbonic anhydrase